MFGVIKEVAKLQNDFAKLLHDKKLSKKMICDLVVPFRDKYNLKDAEALQIARDELELSAMTKLLETSIGATYTIPKWVVEKPDGNVIVTIMKNKLDDTYSFVNLTKGHICECRFESLEAALRDMEDRKLNYRKIG